MNKSRFVLILLISQIVSALIILIVHGLFIPALMVPDHLFGWVGFGVLRVWLETAVVSLVWAAVLRFGLMPAFIRETRPYDPDSPFAEAMPEYPRVLGIGFGFILILTALTLFLHPLASAGQAGALRTSELSRFYLDLAVRSEEQGNNLRAMGLVEESLLLAPSFGDAMLARDRIYAKVAQSPAPVATPEVPVRQTLPLNQSFADMFERARNFYAEGDYFSALYYADQALAVRGRGADPAARALREEARAKIQDVDLSSMQEESRRVFVQKREAITALEEGRFVQSYYLMRELERVYRDDPDIIEWMPRIQDALRSIRFFVDEAQTAYEAGGLGGGLYWLERSEDAKRIWIWSARLSSTVELQPRIDDLEATIGTLVNYYFFDVEAAVLDQQTGQLLAQGYVPFAKAMFLGETNDNGELTWSILTRSIFREAGSDSIAFQWAVEPSAAVLQDQEKLSELGVVDLPVDPPTLIGMGSGGAAPVAMNIAAILSGIEIAGRLGIEDDALKIDFLRRIAIPLIHALMFIWFLGSAWSGRIRRPGVNIVLAVALLPAIYVALYAMQETLFWLVGLLSAFLLPIAGFGLSIAALALVGLVLLILGLFRTAVRSGVKPV